MGLERAFQRASRFGAVVVVCLGLTVLLGWMFQQTWLTRLHPDWVSMKVNTAVLFVAVGAGTWLASHADTMTARRVLGGFVVLVAGATLAQYVFAVDLGIDQMWIVEAVPGLLHPGRMAPVTAVAFLCLGVALFLFDGPRAGIGRALTAVALMAAIPALFGYVYAAYPLHTVGSYTGVALHSAIGFVIASLSLFTAQTSRGPMAVIVSETRVGRSLRRGLPWIAIGPPLLGWLCLRGHELGYYDVNFGFALIVLVNMTSTTTTVLIVGSRMYRLQRQDDNDQRLLFGLGELLGSRGDATDTLVEATRHVGRAFDTSRCTFAEVDAANDQVIVRASYEPNVAPMPAVFPFSSFSAEALADLRAGVPVTLHDLARDPRTSGRFDASYRSLGLAATVSIPLLRNGEWVGLFSVVSATPRQWQPREVILMSHVASHTWAWYEHRVALEDRRRLLVDLTRLAQELEQRVEERTSELRSAHDTLMVALREKEVLIKEIHHRVKNNLQVISSLLHLQGVHVRDPKARSMFSETQTRVQSIALVHEKLYQSRDLSHINFEEYVRTLVRGLMHSLNAEARGIRALVEAVGVKLSVDLAIPCGMMINELVTNALKHAFASGREGSVTVKMRVIDRQRAELIVSDDGVGLAEDVDPRQTQSLGLELVFAFADQIGATVNCQRTGGTSFHFVFPIGGSHATRFDSAG